MKIPEEKLKKIITIDNLKIFHSYLRINKLGVNDKYGIEIEIFKDGVTEKCIIIKMDEDEDIYRRVKINISYLFKTKNDKYIDIIDIMKDENSSIILRTNITYSSLIKEIIQYVKSDEELYEIINDIDEYIPIIYKLYNFIMSPNLVASYLNEKISKHLFFDRLINQNGKNITDYFYKKYIYHNDYINEYGLNIELQFFSYKKNVSIEKNMKYDLVNRNKVFTKFNGTNKKFEYNIRNIKNEYMQYNILNINIMNKDELREAFNMMSYLFSDVITVRRDMVINNIKCNMYIHKEKIELFSYDLLYLKNIIEKCNNMVYNDDVFLLVDLSV